MDKIIVRSRETIKVLPLDIDHVIISIFCSDDTPAEFQSLASTKDVLRVQFDDITIKHVEAYPRVISKYQLFNGVIAKAIADFVEKHKDIPLLICQCDAGISRSSATAAAISKFYKGDDFEFFGSRRYVPNTLVYTILLDELYTRERLKSAKDIGLKFI